MIIMSSTSGLLFSNDDIVLSGYHRKLKTMKKKYFVLYRRTKNSSARLEYYDNEKKFKSRAAPKKVIELKNCFNINRRTDIKHDFVIALSTKDGGFGIVLENEQEMNKWLENLTELQRNESGSPDIPQYGNVWQVTVQKRGLAEEKGIYGPYHVCLSPNAVTLLRYGPELSGERKKTKIEFLLQTIRRCGDSQCLFYMEVGRQSVLGPGELWMETEDQQTAQNMYKTILRAMSIRSDVGIGMTTATLPIVSMNTTEPMRKRSSSANEASKPLNVAHRRQILHENKVTDSTQALQGYVRERCDSLPSARNRTSSECSNQSVSSSFQSFRNVASQRTHSFHRHSNSPPINSNMGCSESEESSLSVDEPDDNGAMFSYRFNNRSSEGVIPEENTDDISSFEMKSDTSCKLDELNLEENYMTMAPVKVCPNTFYKTKNQLNDAKAVQTSATSLNRVPKSAFEFDEFTSDKFVESPVCEPETQMERHARTYSIGSKMEHNRLQKLCNNIENENNTRVRAFSVGSRAKIPRCDLQRNVLIRTNIEHNSNSNNNINFANEVAAYNHNINNIAVREKKSTSAPLLSNKSHNSVDMMEGDLMEIDFSKNVHYPHNQKYSSKPALPVSALASNNTIMPDMPNRRDDSRLQLLLQYRLAPFKTHQSHSQISTHQQQQQQQQQQQPFMFDVNHSTNMAASPTSTSTPTQTAAAPSTTATTSMGSVIEDVVSQTDNGYLEMKPVGNTQNNMSKLYGSTNSSIGQPANTYCSQLTKRRLMGLMDIRPKYLLSPEKNDNGSAESFPKIIDNHMKPHLKKLAKDRNNQSFQTNKVDILSETINDCSLQSSPTTTTQQTQQTTQATQTITTIPNTLKSPTSPIKIMEPMEPMEPMTPTTPLTPVTPATPMTPITPTTPTTPTASLTPATPATPLTPVTPVTPMTPTSPMTPTTPINPEMEAKQQLNNNTTDYMILDDNKTFSKIPKDKDSKKLSNENFKNSKFIEGGTHKLLPHSISEDHCGKNSNSNSNSIPTSNPNSNSNSNANSITNSITAQQDNKSGYEILQIKSDSSLDSSKLFNRISSLRRYKDKSGFSLGEPMMKISTTSAPLTTTAQNILSSLANNKLKTTNHSSLPKSASPTITNNKSPSFKLSTATGTAATPTPTSTSTPTSNSTSASASTSPSPTPSLSPLPAASTLLANNSMANSSPPSPLTTGISTSSLSSTTGLGSGSGSGSGGTSGLAKATATTVERPLSLGSEHRLNYASLDLPKPSLEQSCQSQLVETKITSLTQNAFPAMTNSYVKIDFEQSESQASSATHINI